MTDAIAREVFGLLFETSTEAVFIVDQASRQIVSANLRVADMLAVDPEQLTTMTLLSLCGEPGRNITVPGHYEDVELRRSDGYPVYVELNVADVEVPGRGTYLAYTARDTSERRLLQRELVAKHTALHNAYADLARAHAQLSETKSELEHRNQEIALLAWRAAMGELVAGIAHHLNNPVGALLSTMRRVARIAGDIPGEQRAELERLIVRANQIASRIENNVAAIVQASRSNAGELPSPRELPPELTRVLSTFTEQLDEIPVKEPS